jgi:hypothetical protein
VVLVPYFNGITPSGDHNYPLMRQAGIEWLRFGLGFPFAADLNTPSERFTSRLAEAAALRALGFQLLASSFGPGSMRYVKEQQATVWTSAIPSEAGEPGSERYYQLVESAGELLGARTAELVTWWQVANEPDIAIFRGTLDNAQIAAFLTRAARGIKRGNPCARTGINIGELNDNARALIGLLYRVPDPLFDYIGLDGYFGSWQPGGPESWRAYIDEAHALTDCPVIINEWGYSSLASSPITEDPQRLKHYNQDVCQAKAWNKRWGDGHTPAVQAEYIRIAKRIFTTHPAVRGDFFFKWSDDPVCWQCGQRDCPAECAWGLVDTQGKAKPAYRALAEMNRPG